MALNSVARAENSPSGTILKEQLPLHESSIQVQESHQGKDDSPNPPEPTPLQQTRIGTVLISAAVIDDVMGLVLAAMIPALSALNSGGQSSSLAWTIIRPLLSSVLMTIITPLVARYVFRPLFWFRGLGERWCAPSTSDKPWGSKTIFGCSSEGSKTDGWGTELHADIVKLLVMIVFVSAYSTIAFCTWIPPACLVLLTIVIPIRYWKQHTLRCLPRRMCPVVHFSIA